MHTDEDPRATYAAAVAAEQVELARLRRWHRTVVWMRIVNLVALVLFAAEACSRAHKQVPAALASLGLFVGLTVVIALLERRIARRTGFVRYYEAGQARMQGRPWEGASEGLRFADASHPYAADLDMFGPSSIFATVSTARTSAGQAMLASWLLHPAPIEDIDRRQRAVRELRTQLELRRDLWFAGTAVRKQVRQDALESWLSGKSVPASASARLATGVLGALGLCVLYAFVEPRFIAVAAAIVMVQRLVANKYRAVTQAVQASVFERAWELRVVARLAELIERQTPSDPYLAHLVGRIAADGVPASRHIFRLVRLVDWLESRRNQMFAVVAYALLLPEQLSFAIEAWRTRHGSVAVNWLAAIGELEALVSLATFSFEHPEYAFPELSATAPPSLAATALGHPLLAADVRVTNDVQLGGACPLLVVTGSNMSGKSTLLRTVGVNVALAQAGAPVCASRMVLTPLQIGASLCPQDSLQQGVSRFFAEIKRLQAILLLAARRPPVLFLLDEILNGTNSIDRHDGADAVVRSLLARGAMGLVTTHDLALSTLADAPEVHGANIHFEDHIEGERLVFDYRIRPGVVTRRNALDLMRMIGIDVPGARPRPDEGQA